MVEVKGRDENEWGVVAIVYCQLPLALRLLPCSRTVDRTRIAVARVDEDGDGIVRAGDSGREMRMREWWDARMVGWSVGKEMMIGWMDVNELF